MADAKMKVSQMGAVLAMDDDDLINVVTYNDQSQTYVSGKATGAKVKEYMVGDNDISALGDGSVTGAILNVKTASESADSNIAETMAQNGAHNLLPNTATSQVDNGITFTVNDDGTVTLSGSVGSDRGYSLIPFYDGTNYEFAGKTIIASGGGAIGQHLFMNVAGFDSGGNNVLDSYVREDNKMISIPSSTKRLVVYITISNEYAGSLPQTVYPMLRLSTDPSTEYTPYAMTNGELTEMFKPSLKNSGLTPTYCSITAGGYYEIGNLVIVQIRISNSSDVQNRLIAGFPLYSGYYNHVVLTGFDYGTSTNVPVTIDMDGVMTVMDTSQNGVMITGCYIRS